MTNITLKNIPDDLYARLKEAATIHHRSINSEFIASLEKMLPPRRWTAEEHLAKARALRQRVKVKKISSKIITEAKNQGRL
jgi:plasmid stability protein